MTSRRHTYRNNRRGIGVSGGAPGLPLSFWADGGYWDLSTLTGAQNSDISAGINSLSNAAVLTPSSAVKPRLHLNGVMGMNAARLVEDTATGANFQFLHCDALAALFTGTPAPVSVYMHCRVHKNANRPYWMAGRSDGASTERIAGRFNSETPNIHKHWTGPGNAAYAGTRMVDPYSSHHILWTCDGTNWTIYQRNEGQSNLVTMALGPMNLTALSSGVNRFTFGASRSSVPFEALSAYIVRCGVAARSITLAQATSLFNQNDVANYATPRATGRIFIYPGDSITLCTQDSFMSGGHREILATFSYDNALSWYSYANGQGGGGSGAGGAGIYRLGLTGNSFTSSNSGQTIAAIETQALTDISGSATPVRFYPCIMGSGDNNALVAPATIASRYLSSATSIMNSGIARDPSFRMSVTTIPPLDRATLASIDDNAQAFNALLRDPGGIFDQLDALFPNNKPFRWDCYQALDNIYSAAYFADASHPSRPGHVRMACHPTYGQLWATDGAQTLATWLRSNSPSAARPCALTGAISSPAPAAIIASGSPTDILANCTRVACRAIFKVDGVDVGTMTPLDTYSHFAAGTFAHTPINTYSYSWTPGAPDIGARALTVEFTDPDGVTVATSDSVNITVS